LHKGAVEEVKLKGAFLRKREADTLASEFE
jgi:hypothetical protein